jgi:putative ABC transport system ATP-binding protein
MLAVDVNNLNFSFGEGALKRSVLKGIVLTIQAGEIVIMTGPSGSGKTTLLTILGGLRRAFEGSVQVLGTQLIDANEQTQMNIRRRTGYIFQQHNLLPPLTALQNVCMTLEPMYELNQVERNRIATTMLQSVGLGDHLNKKPAQLSGGQRQRVSIARALVHKPEIILADEPTASLDKASGHECVEILKQLAREQNTTILMVTHDYRILDMADRVIELEDGHLKV